MAFCETQCLTIGLTGGLTNNWGFYMDKIFQRDPTNAEKAHLILHLLDVGLPEWTGDENKDLCWVYVALTGQDYDVAKRAFIDAARFGMANIDGEDFNA